MRYLVTGGLGVIGSRIVHNLLNSSNSVTIIDAAEEPRNEWIAKELEARCEILRGRIEQKSEHIPRIVRDVDAVIHCAAHTGIPHSVIDPSDDWASNVDATRVLLEALRKYPRPMVALSSIKPYRVLPLPPHGLDETAVLDPDEPYAASKAAQSMLCMAYGHSYNLPVVVFRCSNLYGPAPCHGPRHGWMTWFAISAAMGRPLQVQGTGQQSRDMLHADDVYSAARLALDSAARLSGRCFNLGGGESNVISVGEAASWLSEQTGVSIERAPSRAMDDMHVFVNCSDFFRETGWLPKTGVREGMASVLEWARSNADDMRSIYKDVQ